MALSRQAKDYINKKRRERYANDPAFREKQKRRVEAYYERKAAEAALEDQNDQPGSGEDQQAVDHKGEPAATVSTGEGVTV